MFSTFTITISFKETPVEKTLYDKKLLLNEIGDKIAELKKDLQLIIEEKKKEDVSDKSFLFLKKLFRIPIVPKYLSEGEAYEYFNIYANYRDENWWEYYHTSQHIPILTNIKTDIELVDGDSIELSESRKSTLYNYDINYEISEIKNPATTGK